MVRLAADTVTGAAEGAIAVISAVEEIGPNPTMGLFDLLTIDGSADAAAPPNGGRVCALTLLCFGDG